MSKKFKKDEIILFEYPYLFRRTAFLNKDSVEIVEEYWEDSTQRWEYDRAFFIAAKDIHKLSEWLEEDNNE